MPSYHNLDDTIKYLLDPYAHASYIEAERICELQDALREEAAALEAERQQRGADHDGSKDGQSPNRLPGKEGEG